MGFIDGAGGNSTGPTDGGDSNDSNNVNPEDQKNFEKTLNGDRDNKDNRDDSSYNYFDGSTEQTPWGTSTPMVVVSEVPVHTNSSGWGNGNSGNVGYGINSGGGDGGSGSESSGIGFGGGSNGWSPFTAPGQEIDFHDLFSEPTGSNSLHGYTGPPDSPLETPLIDEFDIALAAYGLVKTGLTIGRIVKSGFRIASKNIDNAVIGKPRIGSANKLPDGQHGFNDIIDNYVGDAAKFDIPTKGPGGKVVRTSELRQIQGSNNGVDGVFEWIVDQGNVTHRRFIPGGKVTGHPNQIPK